MQAASFLIFQILVRHVWKFKNKSEFQKSEIFTLQKQFHKLCFHVLFARILLAFADNAKAYYHPG